MKRLLLLILLSTALTNCKKDDPDPLPEVAAIVGKWRVVAYTRTIGDSTVTESISKEHSYVYEIRYDGVILNENGKVPCCLPTRLFIDGKELVTKPMEPAEPDPICASTYCMPCPEMRITRPIADGLTIETCEGLITSYAREK